MYVKIYFVKIAKEGGAEAEVGREEEEGESEKTKRVLDKMNALKALEEANIRGKNLDHDKEQEALRGNTFLRLLVKSFATSTYGQESMKTAYVLQQLSGTSHKRVANEVRMRSTCHLCSVGEPSVSKTHTGKSSGKLAPKFGLICGGGTTPAGLTGAVSVDEDTGRAALSIGILTGWSQVSSEGCHFSKPHLKMLNIFRLIYIYGTLIIL